MSESGHRCFLVRFASNLLGCVTLREGLFLRKLTSMAAAESGWGSLTMLSVFSIVFIGVEFELVLPSC
ncbi:MAG: hypothetical protein ACI8P0_003690 [Planctomycetaceae bacterium]|jgi:hypothetical protein